MRQLTKPPIQLLLWMGGITCLLLGGWSVWQLRQVEETQFSAANVRVDIPESSALSVPGIGSYRKLVSAPLFWEERAIPRKAPSRPPRAVVQRPVVPEVVPELIPPTGRVVGIVDLGKRYYALVRDEEQLNITLNKGDDWDGWTVDSIDSNRVVLVAGEQRTEMSLIGDFEAPKVNKTMLAARQREEQRKKRQQLMAVRQKQATGQQPKTEAIPQLAPAAASSVKQAEQEQEMAPVLSIKEALEARRRLMASRWGKKDAGQ